MKLFFLLFLITIIAICVYLYFSRKTSLKNKQRRKGINRKAITITGVVTIVLLGLVGFGLYTSATAPDTQCMTTHKTTSTPPQSLNSANDYLMQGNYDYDIGNCTQAVAAYTKAISLNPNYSEAYNNRAYTDMRMRDYKNALPDLDKAIQLNPNYIQALMNRGDIHNYYYSIDKQSAIADYQKVIALGGTQNTSVCGHLILARNNGWNPGTFFDILTHFPPTNHC